MKAIGKIRNATFGGDCAWKSADFPRTWWQP